VEVKRVFVAVPVDEETRHRLAHQLAGTFDTMPGRIVRPENWHVTLRFLGEQPDEAVDRLLGSLDQTQLGPSFSLRWSELGAFPRARRATVLWLGLEEESGLAALYSRVEGAIEGAGFGVDDRPFNPHMTLSRVRPPQDVTATISAGRVSSTMKADRVSVYESRRGESGPSYHVIEEFLLDE
jgi:2'-5' RNA ligase